MRVSVPVRECFTMNANPTIEELTARIRDLERKLGEYEKREARGLTSEEFWRSANRSRDIIYRYDLKKRRFLFGNKAALEFCGLAVKDDRVATTRSILFSIHPDDADTVRRARQVSLSAGSGGGEAEYRIVRADGSLRWLQDRWVITTDEDGTPAIAEGTARDITERKQAEEMLRQSEEKFSRAFRHSSLGFTITSLRDGRYLDVNDSYCAMSGFSREELIGKSIFDEEIDIWESRKDGLQLREILLQHGKANDFDFRFRRKSGEVGWGILSAVIVEIAGEKCIISQAIDITKRKQLEEAVQANRELLLDITSQVPGVIYQFYARPDGKFGMRYVSDRAVETLGAHYDTADYFNRFVELVIPEHRDGFLQSIAKAVREASEWNFEGMLEKPSGEKIWFSGNSLPSARKDEIVFSGIVRDITEQKRAEEELRQIVNIQSLILNNSVMGIAFVRNRTFEWVNQRIPEMLGLPLHEVQGAGTRIVFPSDECFEESGQRAYAALSKGEWFDLEIDVPRSDGTHLMGRMVGKALDPDHPQEGSIWIFEDITENRKAEEEKRSLQERLQRAEKMEALGTLAGGVAHDLNNVLGVVIGYAELLLMDANISTAFKSPLTSIMNGGQKAAAIVQDLLTLARRGVSGRKVHNLNTIIAACRQSPEFERLRSYHPSVRITTDLEPDLLNVSGSSVHLEKTLFNLVSNACEAMPHGGSVTIRTANHYLDRPIRGYDDIREGDYVVLSISDTGEGIRASDLNRIFEPFYTKKVMGRSGTGLGLAVVWGTVKDHHGYINVESEEGNGSTFTLYFPVTRDAVSAESTVLSIDAYRGNGESILVVDDAADQRELAANMLRKLNYTVTSVSSGEKAVAYLKEHHADLMVLDMIMDPGMDGLDTYTRVLEIHPKQKAIIVSGFSESHRVHTAQVLGAGAYVKKPYVIEKLGLAVKDALARPPVS